MSWPSAYLMGSWDGAVVWQSRGREAQRDGELCASQPECALFPPAAPALGNLLLRRSVRDKSRSQDCTEHVLRGTSIRTTWPSLPVLTGADSLGSRPATAPAAEPWWGKGLGPGPRPLLGPLAGLWLVSERETGAEAPVTSSGAPPNNAETRGAIPPSDNDPLPVTWPTRSRRDGRRTWSRPGSGLAVSDGGLAPLWPEDEEGMDSLANGHNSWPVSGACAHPE